jgi:hypothetical protein
MPKYCVLCQKLLYENKITSTVTGYSEAVKTRMERCASVSMDVMEHSEHLAYWETVIKVVQLNELYAPYYVPMLCVMCHSVKNE